MKLWEEFKAASWGQHQITGCSHLFVFYHYRRVKPEHVDRYMALKASVQKLDIQSLKGYAAFIKGKFDEQAEEVLRSWMARQTYLALGNLLAAWAE